MKLAEFGRRVRNRPDIKRKYKKELLNWDDEEVGRRYLQTHPEYRSEIDDAPPTGLMKVVKTVFGTIDSPEPTFADRLTELAMDPVGANKSWTESWGDHARTVGQQVENRANVIRAVEYAAVAAKAIQQGLTVEAYIHAHQAHVMMQIETHKTNEAIRLERAQRDTGIEVAIRLSLKSYELLDGRRREINVLIDEFDNESHPKKREALAIVIEAGLEELRGRANQEVDKAGGRSGVGRPDEDADGSRNSSTSTERDAEPITVKGFRVGE